MPILMSLIDKRSDGDAADLKRLIGAPGNDGKSDECGNETKNRRHGEQELVGAGGDNVFLKEEFDGIRKRLENAVGPHFHRTHAVLHPAEDFSLRKGEDEHRDDHDAHDRGDLGQGDSETQSEFSHDRTPRLAQ